MVIVVAEHIAVHIPGVTCRDDIQNPADQEEKEKYYFACSEQDEQCANMLIGPMF